jgi:hypothetical protein
MLAPYDTVAPVSTRGAPRLTRSQEGAAGDGCGTPSSMPPGSAQKVRSSASKAAPTLEQKRAKPSEKPPGGPQHTG